MTLVDLPHGMPPVGLLVEILAVGTLEQQLMVPLAETGDLATEPLRFLTSPSMRTESLMTALVVVVIPAASKLILAH